MVERTTTTSKFAATVLVTVNLIVMISCALVFAFGLWMIASPTTLLIAIESIGSATIKFYIGYILSRYSYGNEYQAAKTMRSRYLKALLPPEVLTVHLGVGLAALSTFMFFVAIMGFWGALTRSQFLLFMYSTMVLLLLLLECALLYYFSSNLIEKGLQEKDGQWTHALRLAFGCCDHNTTTADTLKPPWSCCGPRAHPDNCTINHAYNKNCQRVIAAWLDTYQTAVYASLVCVHVVLCTCALVRRS